jgi:hypothetical protein
MSDMDRTDEVARAKCGAPDSVWWRPYSYEALPGGDILIKGAAWRPKLSGKHKGQPMWPKPLQHHITVVVTKAETEQRRDEYEAETGFCSNCNHKGEVSTGWSRDGGTRWGKCKRCGGTGEAR